jgi:RNA polymerase sigma-70 factor (ECF subfamily)
VFLRAYGAFARLRPDSNHRAWLYKIATNCACTALSQARRQSARQVTLDDEFQPMPAQESRSPESIAILNETLEAIRSEIGALPPKQQTAVVLRHLQGLDYVDIAQALGCSEDSARANVYQGLRRLRRLLAQGWS